MDRGTENIYCEDLQVYFTKNAESFVYASSTRNQRIECLWSRLKKFRLNWWINFFSEITKISLFKPHLSSHQECLLFCFLPIIQAELNEVIEITIPQSAEEALDLYVSLLRCLSSDSFEVSE